MTLLIDENLPRYWVNFLAASGFTAIHWLEIGAVGAADDEIFSYAETHRAVVITQDLDFTRMLATRGALLPSIIQLRVDCPIPEVIGMALISVLHSHSQSLEVGCLISLDHAKHRLRLLPIR